MPPHEWAQVRRILVICPGDEEVLRQTGPALRLLRETLPAAHLTLWTPTGNADVARTLTGIQELLLSPMAWTGTLMPLIRALHNRAFGASIILTDVDQSPYPAAYVCYLAAIPIRLGQSREFGGSILSPWIRPQTDPGSRQEHHLHLLRQAGLDGSPKVTERRSDKRNAHKAMVVTTTIASGEEQ